MSDFELSDLDLATEEIKRLQKELDEARKEKKEREEQDQLNPYKYYPSTYGWVCPVCGQGCSPWQATCPCKTSWTLTCS